jgi:hypothetical protein
LGKLRIISQHWVASDESCSILVMAARRRERSEAGDGVTCWVRSAFGGGEEGEFVVGGEDGERRSPGVEDAVLVLGEENVESVGSAWMRVRASMI